MKPIVMGILNCTPDSFYEGSRMQTEYEIEARAEQIISEGGSIIDVGAYSTRPGATEVSQDEEMRRLRMALTAIRRGHGKATLSVDTFRAEVAQMAVEEFGVELINDVTEGADEGMFATVGRLKAGYVLMSVQPDMDSMVEHFRKEVDKLQALGVERIILDPGFGFGKTPVVEGNYQVLNGMQRLREEFPELPVLAGVSRKRMVWQLLDCSPNDTTALQGTMLLNLLALERGADILRVHDVKEAADTIKVYEALNS
ncbi:MAG: dihydropteroate synthase [Prevotella sp.]|nr:dihydropteroate synthase [Prevotella sp.]